MKIFKIVCGQYEDIHVSIIKSNTLEQAVEIAESKYGKLDQDKGYLWCVKEIHLVQNELVTLYEA